MSWRYLPPVHSPISGASLAAGLLAALRGDRGARERVQRALGAFYGVTRVLLTDSGTSALTVAMRSAIAGAGRNVIALPGYCCYDLITALNGAEAEVVFYDLDPETLNPEWGSFESALAAGPAAVVVAHLYGLPVDMPRVMDLAEYHHTTVIEDAAQGIGGSIAGRPLGAFGHLRVLSFGRGKGVTAGRGGALLAAPGWRGEADRQRSWSAHRGSLELFPLLAQALLGKPTVYRIPAAMPWLALGETEYREPSPPGGISGIAAAVLEQNWKGQQREAVVRRRNASRILEMLADDPALRAVRPVPGAEPGWLRLPVILEGIERDDPRMRRARALGVMSGYPRPLIALEALPKPHPAPLAGSTRLASELWTIPTHALLQDRDFAGLLGWVRLMRR